MSDSTITIYESPDDFNKLVEANRKNGWQSLSPAERMFAYYYVETYNARTAAEDCGMAPSAGLRLLRKPLIQALVSHVQEQMQARSLINADFVRVQWLQLLPKLMGEEEVAMVDKGMSFQAKKFHAGEATRALTELGKSTKFYEGGTPNGGNVVVNIDLGALGINTGTTIEGDIVDGEIE